MIDTTNIAHSDAFLILREEPFVRIPMVLGSVSFRYVQEDIIGVFAPWGERLGIGRTVRLALTDAWNYICKEQEKENGI